MKRFFTRTALLLGVALFLMNPVAGRAEHHHHYNDGHHHYWRGHFYGRPYYGYPYYGSPYGFRYGFYDAWGFWHPY